MADKVDFYVNKERQALPLPKEVQELLNAHVDEYFKSHPGFTYTDFDRACYRMGFAFCFEKIMNGEIKP